MLKSTILAATSFATLLRKTVTDMFQNIPLRFQLAYLAWATLIYLIALPVIAADLSGQYFGVDRAHDHTLTVEQLGTKVTGDIAGPDWRLEFEGANDGSNMANVGITLWSGGAKQSGFMIMRWQPSGIQVSLIVKSDRAISGQYHFVQAVPNTQEKK